MADRIDTLIILGANGDLTGRLLLPGLATFLASRRSQPVRLIGVDRAPTTGASTEATADDQWRDRVRDSFSATPSEAADDVVAAATFIAADVTSAADLARVLDAAEGRVALYFALPPAVAELACTTLSSMTLPPGIMLALEKPFGTDLASAKALNRLLETMLPEEQIFRVDHFLGKSTVLNILGLRFANRIVASAFTASEIERVDISFDETLALENRAGYYDRAGALVDMIQSHLLLVLALVAMEPPATLDADDLRGAMAQVLRATRSQKRRGTSSRRARYGAGTIDGRELPAYVDERGVDAARSTETLAEVTLEIDTWRWAGVPFTLRSGKALGEAKQEVLVTFRPVPHLPTGFVGLEGPTVLRIGMKPATVELDLVVNGEHDPFTLEHAVLRTELADGELSAYGEVIAGLLEGDPVFSVRGDVAEQCWRIVEPILAAWKKGAVSLDTYPAGSSGPAEW